MYLAYVALVDSASCKYRYAAVGKGVEFLEHRYALLGGGLLSRRKHAFDAKTNELVECLVRIVAAVESAVECHRHALGSCHQTSVGLHIERSVGIEAAYHYAVNAQLLAHAYVLLHALHFERSIEEIASARSDYHVQACRGEQSARHLNLAIRRSGSAFRYSSAQFHAVGTAFLRSQTTLYAIGAYFKQAFLLHNIHCLYYM